MTRPRSSAERSMTTDDELAVPRVAYSLREVMKATTLGKTTVLKLVASGQLRTVQVGSRRLVPVDALNELMEGGAA